jgi:hypothetical protein
MTRKTPLLVVRDLQLRPTPACENTDPPSRSISELWVNHLVHFVHPVCTSLYWAKGLQEQVSCLMGRTNRTQTQSRRDAIEHNPLPVIPLLR